MYSTRGALYVRLNPCKKISSVTRMEQDGVEQQQTQDSDVNGKEMESNGDKVP